MSRLGIRRRLLLVVVGAVAATVAALVLGFNLILMRTLDHDARDLVRSRAVAQLSLLHDANGRVDLGEAPDGAATDAYLWVFSGGRTLERPPSGRVVDAAAHRLAGGPRRFLDVPSADTRLYATPVVSDGRRIATVVAGVSLAPYEATRRVALVASLALGGALLLLAVLAARWVLAASLRPVRRMTRQAAAWSEHDLEDRFELGEPHDELTELAATLDALLDRLAASLRREQRFSAELSHELRTPLSRVIAESELALRREREPHEYREALELVHGNAVQLARIVDALVAAAHHEAGSGRGTADAHTVAVDVATACEALASERRISIEVKPPPRPLRVGVDQDLAERILQPILENACRYGTSSVSLSISRQSSSVRYEIGDDGPGVAPDEREHIFEPGVRGLAGVADGPDGSGLGLALARRLARAVSGDIDAVAANGGGGRFVVRLPVG
jgi:signal transduction histidine kinase